MDSEVRSPIRIDMAMGNVKSNRREFLRGRAALNELANLSGEKLDLPPASGLLTTLSRRAMACQFEVLLNTGQYAGGTEAALAALDLVDELEAQLSVFRDDSEVSLLNARAANRPVEVEPRMFALLALAAAIYQQTGGAYDIATGRLTKLWGFFRRQGRVPQADELAEAMKSVGMQHVRLDHERQSVRFLQPGVEINLGSIGKGYALDRMAELLTAAGIENFLLHGGNSSVLGHGSSGDCTNASPPNLPDVVPAALRPPVEPGAKMSNLDCGWRIGLRHPLEPERRIGEIRLRNRALGTSGSGVQFFEHQGRRYGHILDPRTGWPADGVLSTTIAAPSGAQADALATACYVLGSRAAIDYCRKQAGISAVIMSPSADESAVDVALCGWSDGDINIAPSDGISIRPIEK
jgi:FAD:protein FMN transferase